MKNPPSRAGLSVVRVKCNLANSFHLNRPRLSSGNSVSANGSACAEFTPFPRRVALQPEGEAMSELSPEITIPSGLRRFPLTMLSVRDQADQFKGVPRGSGKPFRYLAAAGL